MRALVIVAVLAGTAHAEHEAELAKQLELPEAAVHDVAGYELSTADFTHALVGRFDAGGTSITALVIMKCDGECVGRKVELGTTDALDVLGIVDLQGEPTPLPARAASGKLPGSKRAKFPVLAVRAHESKTVTRGGRSSRDTRTKLYLISLVEADRGSIVYMDTVDERLASGTGMTRTFRLDRGDGKTNLDLVISERHLGDSKCAEPDEIRYSLEDHHYRPKSYAPRTGC